MLFEHVAWLSGGGDGGRGSGPWSDFASARNIGLVVGATDTASMKRARARAPQTWFLVPGVGAQGGAMEATLEAGLRADGSGLLVSVSRGISRAADPAAAARALNESINACRAAQAAAGADGADGAAGAALAPYQRELIGAAMDAGALKFGSFTLKSGRTSPYFFNAGNLFSSGQRLAKVAACYAAAVVRAGFEFDVVFGPAYKGIPLATAVGVALAMHHGMDVGVACVCVLVYAAHRLGRFRTLRAHAAPPPPLPSPRARARARSLSLSLSRSPSGSPRPSHSPSGTTGRSRRITARGGSSLVPTWSASAFCSWTM